MMTYNANTLKYVAPNLMDSTELVALDALKENPHNPKLHPKSQINELVRSIKEFCFSDPIVTNEDLQILEGHGRLMAARQLKMSHVPVIRLNHLTDDQQTAYLVAHNKLNAMTDVDLFKLKPLEMALQKFDFIGLSEQEVSIMQAAREQEHPDDLPAQSLPQPAMAGEELAGDDLPEAPAEPVYKHECPSCGYAW